MSPRLARLPIALCSILGTVLLGVYFGVGFSMPQLPLDATIAQVVSVATQYHNLWLLGAWVQATGSLLSVIFYLALVHQAGGTARLAGMLTLLGSAVLLAVVLIEGVFTIDLAQAAANGHQATSLTSYDFMGVFVHIYPIVPAPLIYLALGTILLGSHVLPRLFGYLALVVGSVYVVVGLVGLFTTPVLTLVALGLQSLWVLAAAVTLLVQGVKAADAAAAQAQQVAPA